MTAFYEPADVDTPRSSDRRTCPVCDDLRRVRLVRLMLPNVAGRGVSCCPRCSPEPGHNPVPAFAVHQLVESPRGAA